MNKLTPSVFALLSIFAIGTVVPSNAYADPSSSETASVEKPKVKKKVVKKKKVKKKQKVVQPTVAELKTQCYNNYSLGSEISASAFFACDSIGLPSSKFETPVTRAAAKAEQGWFGSSNIQKTINEASKLEGLNTRKDREAIKTYLKASNNKETPVDPVRTPWCAAFANAVLRRTGYEGTDSLMARSFLTYGIKTKDPKEGDIVVLKRGKGSVTGHVGFFNGYEWEGDQLYVKVLGGNQNKSVNVAYFPVNYVLDYRRPV
jgi:uncharacterized protein (TIGR02594 family)